MYETINSSVNYGGLELKNRIIFAPTTFGLSDEEYFEKNPPHRCGRLRHGHHRRCLWAKSMIEKSLFDKKGFAYYQKLTEIVHSYDCRICAQLHQSDSNMLAMLKYVPGVLTKKNLDAGAASPAERRGRALHLQAVCEEDQKDHRWLRQGR